MNFPIVKGHKQIISKVTLAAFLCLFLYGFIDNLKGATLPHLFANFHYSYSQGGAIQQGAYFGFLASTLLTGFLIQRFTHHQILLVAAVCTIAGILTYSVFHQFTILLLSMVVIGLGLGFLDLIGVRLIVDFCKQDTGHLLNLIAFFHDLDSMIAPLSSGIVLSIGFHSENVCHFGLIFTLALLAIILLIRFPDVEKPSANTVSENGHILIALCERKAWLYYILIMSYETIEIGFAVWISEFLQSTRAQSASFGFSFLSLFFFFIMLGRLLGSWYHCGSGRYDLRFLFIHPHGTQHRRHDLPRYT